MAAERPSTQARLNRLRGLWHRLPAAVALVCAQRQEHGRRAEEPGLQGVKEAAEREHTESARDAERDATCEHGQRRCRGGEGRQAFGKSRFPRRQVYRARQPFRRVSARGVPVTFNPRSVVARSASMTSSASVSGTSTSEKPSLISIAPIDATRYRLRR